MTFVVVAIVVIWVLALLEDLREKYANARAAARDALRAASERGEIGPEALARGLMALEQAG